MIEVEYDGEYPFACSGRLIVKEDGVVTYDKECCCHPIECEERLVWDDADKFSDDIQEAVEKRLSEVIVCCGGCT